MTTSAAEFQRMADDGFSVSVVIPCYNHGDFVAGAIESVLSQPVRLEKIVVVDDGSTDQTPQVVRRFAPAVQYIRQDNAGASAARNRGVREVTSEWVGFLDADDRWLEGMLAAQLSVLAAHLRLDALISDFRVETPDGQAVNRADDRHQLGKTTVQWSRHMHPEVWIAEDRLVEGMLIDFLGAPCNSTYLVRRSVWESLGGLDEAYHTSEDLDLSLRFAKEGRRLGYLPVPTALRLAVPNSLCRDNPRVTKDRLRVLEGFARNYRLSKCEARIVRQETARCEIGLAWQARQQGQLARSRHYATRAIGYGLWRTGIRALLRTLPVLRRFRTTEAAFRQGEASGQTNADAKV